MKTRRSILVLGFAALMLCATPVRAEQVAAVASAPAEKPLFTRVAYEAYWGPLLVARVSFTLDAKPGAYKTDMTIRPAGVVTWMTDNFSADLISEGVFDGKGDAHPALFRRSWRSDKKQGAVVVDYDPKTGIALGIEDGKPDEKVAEELRKDVIDPLAVLTAARHRLLRGKNPDLGLKVYDGKRRFNMDGKINPPKHMTFRNQEYKIIPVTLQFVPLAGFNKKQHDGWMGSEFEIFFTTDGHATPFQIFLETKLGWLRLYLVNDCVSQDGECQLAAK